MNYEQITNLTVNDCRLLLEQRLIDKGIVMTEENLLAELWDYKGELLITLREELVAEYLAISGEEVSEEDTIPEIIAMIEAINLTNAREEFEALVLTYVEKGELNELLTSEEIRNLIQSLIYQDEAIIEKKRREDLLARFDSVNQSDFREAMLVIGLDENMISNLKYFRNVSLLGDNPRWEKSNEEILVILEQIEAAIPEIEQSRLKREAKEARAINGRQVRDLTNRIMDVIIGFNIENQADASALAIRFADILSLLQRYQPFTAKGLIQSIEVDETVTQEMIDEIIDCY